MAGPRVGESVAPQRIAGLVQLMGEVGKLRVSSQRLFRLDKKIKLEIVFMAPEVLDKSVGSWGECPQAHC